MEVIGRNHSIFMAPNPTTERPASLLSGHLCGLARNAGVEIDRGRTLGQVHSRLLRRTVALFPFSCSLRMSTAVARPTTARLSPTVRGPAALVSSDHRGRLLVGGAETSATVVLSDHRADSQLVERRRPNRQEGINRTAVGDRLWSEAHPTV